MVEGNLSLPLEANSFEPAKIPEKPKERSERIEVNIIRIYAMFIVVMIHVASLLAPHYNTVSFHDWWVANLYHAITKGGPPMFTMVSGMLLLAKDQDLKSFFSKRFSKVLFPFVIWALIYIGYRAIVKGETFDFKAVLQAILQGPPYYHLWFIQMILGLYFATPILRVYVRNASRANLRYFLIIWAVAVGGMPIFSRLLSFNLNVQFVVTTGFVGYFVLGYYLKDVVLSPKQWWIAPFTAVIGILITEFGTLYLVQNNDGVFDDFYLNNLSLNIMLVSTSLFLMLKSLPYEQFFSQHPKLKSTLIALSSYSFGVYFVHVMIMEFLASGVLGFQLQVGSFNPIFSIPFITLLTFLLSILIVVILKKVPVVKLIAP
jgi:surface polysaccharide O-acyltransferase-like enzyme